jgi:hypothetical protein
MMRLTMAIMVLLLFFGCIGGGEEVNDTVDSNGANVTVPVNDSVTANQTANAIPSGWQTHTTDQFRFQYPSNMDVQEGQGLFTGDHAFDGTTGTVLVVMYYDASKVHGVNQDKEFQERPSQAATSLLKDDIDEDPIHMLDEAEETGNITEFSIGRDTFVSQVPFKIKFQGFINTYDGYALSMYVPERSHHIKVRIIALDPQKAEDILDNFLLTYSLE